MPSIQSDMAEHATQLFHCFHSAVLLVVFDQYTGRTILVVFTESHTKHFLWQYYCYLCLYNLEKSIWLHWAPRSLTICLLLGDLSKHATRAYLCLISLFHIPSLFYVVFSMSSVLSSTFFLVVIDKLLWKLSDGNSGVSICALNLGGAEPLHRQTAACAVLWLSLVTL